MSTGSGTCAQNRSIAELELVESPLKNKVMKGWMYILECSDGSYYIGSTNNLELRIQQHSAGEGLNHTKKHLPVKLVYFEEFERIDYAFNREKQVQKWRREKKEALIDGFFENSDVDRLRHLFPKQKYRGARACRRHRKIDSFKKLVPGA